MERNETTFFTDNRGDRYSLKMSYADVQKLKEHPDINLDIGKIIESNRNVFEILYGDPFKLVIIATELTRQSRRATGLSDEDFLARLEGDVLDDVTVAFVNALVACLPKHLRTTLKAAIEKSFIEVEKIASVQVDLLKETEINSTQLKKKLKATLDEAIATAQSSGEM